MNGQPILCISCGYDLRAQPREGNCPECGSPVKTAHEQVDADWAFYECRSELSGMLRLACRVVVPAILVLNCLFVLYEYQIGIVFSVIWVVIAIMLGIAIHVWATSNPERAERGRAGLAVTIIGGGVLFVTNFIVAIVSSW